jgi:hypothetical protein
MKAATYVVLMVVLMAGAWSDNYRDIGMMALGALVFMLVAKVVRS